MSLINDALKRASQTQKDRPHQAATPLGMEAVPTSNKSPMTGILVVVVVIALALAGWFFRQWWVMRKNMTAAPVVAAVAPVAPVAVAHVQAAPPPVATPAPRPVPPPAPVVVAKPAPAPVSAPAPVAVAPPTPPVPTMAVNESMAVWPNDIKVSAIFFSRTTPRAMIGSNIYGIGDDIEGATVKRIGKDKVVLELNGHTKEFYLEGQ